MGKWASDDERYLERHRGKWRVVLAVPRDLHGRFGTKLKRPLNTDSLAVANILKWHVMSELREVLLTASINGGKQDIIKEALELAALRSRADVEIEHLDYGIEHRAEQLLGDPVDTEVGPNGGPLYVYDPKREEHARLYAAVARGEATPLAHHHDQYLGQAITKARTKGDDKRALGFLQAWCEKEKITPVLQAITRKVATRFMDGLHEIAAGRDGVTLNKYLGRLRRYWAWLKKREHVLDNPWQSLKIAVPQTSYAHKEREFTDAEMVKLLESPCPPGLRDVVMIGALSGARLDAIVDLKVKDCATDTFIFKPQKREPKARAVPIHSGLKAIVKRRMAGKQPDDSLFPEWPAPKKVGSQRERSFKTSNAFTAYRRSVGVDERVDGKRRSLVNFHSLRRWFITKAEQADQAPHIIKVVVGHKRDGETLGRYSSGPLMKQARRCVEAVKLPKHSAPKLR